MPLEHVDLSDQVVHRSLADLARARVLQDILQRRLEPGALIQLKSLADAYGMSRTPVREALTQLQQSGLVVAIPYKGYRISPIDRGDIEDVIFMRHLLEPIAAERAATNITADQLADWRPCSHRTPTNWTSSSTGTPRSSTPSSASPPVRSGWLR